MSDPTFAPPLDKLRTFGEPHDLFDWPNGVPDYVAALGLGPDHIDRLIDAARTWVEPRDAPRDDDDDDETDEEDASVYAPIHAWRALGQLRARDAVGPLLGMLDAADEMEDDWCLTEFPHVFALVGPYAFDPVADYLDDATHAPFARICAADALHHLALRHPETRDRAVARLAMVLEQFEQNDPEFNALMIIDLVGLKAVEAADLIERAFADDQVDESVCGTWGMVRRELRVEGQGLAPDGDDIRLFPHIVPSLRNPLGLPPNGTGGSGGGKSKEQRRKERKLERKAKKKNRR